MTALQQNARGGTTDPAPGSSDDDDFVHVNDSRLFVRAAADRKQPTPRTNGACSHRAKPDHNCADGVMFVRVPKFSSTYQLS
jgi:hypothetical protein